MEDSLQEKLAARLVEYDKLLESVAVSAEEAPEVHVIDLARTEGASAVQELIDQLTRTANRFGRAAAHELEGLSVQFAREAVTRTPLDLFSSMKLTWTLTGVLDGIHEDDDSTDDPLCPQVAHEAVSAISARGWSDHPAVDFVLLRELASFGAAQEALRLALEFRDPSPDLLRCIGFMAHKAGDHQLAVEELGPHADAIEGEELRALGDSLFFLRREDEALAYYDMALKMAVAPSDRLACALGLGKCYIAQSGWSSAVEALRAVVDEVDNDRVSSVYPDMDECRLQQQCLMIIGFAETQFHWSKRSSLEIADSLLGDLDDALDALRMEAFFEDCGRLSLSDFFMLSRASGCFRAMKDIVKNTSSERDRLARETQQLLEHSCAQSQRNERMRVQLDRLEAGWRPYAERLLREFTGLPTQAAESLAWAMFQWKELKNECLPVSVVQLVGRAVEIVLQAGLVRVLQSAGGAFADQDASEVTIGNVTYERE